MIIEEAVWSRLTADATLAALVATRVYPGQAPDDPVFPLVIYQEASRKTARALASIVNLDSYSLRLDCYGETYRQAKDTRNAIKASLNGFRGPIGTGGVLTVRSVIDETSDDGALAPIHADEFGIYRAGLTLAIHYGST